MAVSFNAIQAGTTKFGQLINAGSAQWVQLWTGNYVDGKYVGSFVNTSAFNEFGHGWIAVSDLANLDLDFAQYNDGQLWVKTWKDGVTSDWIGNQNVNFQTSTQVAASIVTEISAPTTLNNMFTPKNTGAGDHWYQVWIGKQVNGQWVGNFIETADDNWIRLADLGKYTVKPEDFAGGNQLYIQQASKGPGASGYQVYGWENWPVDVPPDVPTYTLAEAIVAKLAGELPAEYNIDPDEPFNAEGVTVEAAGETYPLVQEILDDAKNAADLDIEELFMWSIEDTAANILANADEAVVTGADAVSITDDVVTVAQAADLLDLENFDGVYDLEDSFDTLWANRDADVVANAASYSLTDEEGKNFGNITQDQANFIKDAANYEGSGWTWGILGNTIALTTGTDIVGPEAKDTKFQTTDHNDTITGVVSGLSSERTLNPADQIDGGKGEDILDLTIKGSFAGFTGDGFLKNVETVNLTNDTSIVREFNAKDVKGVNTYNIDATKAAIELKSLEETGIAVNVTGQAAGTIKADFTADAMKDVTKALALGLMDVGKAGESFDKHTFVVVDIDDIKDLTINSKGTANFVNLSGMGAVTNIMVAGSGDLFIEEVANKLTAFDASAAKGSIAAALSDSGAMTKVLLGDGDDAVRVNIDSGLTVNAQLDGGKGFNVLTVDGQGTVQPFMTNFQMVRFDAGVKGDITFSGTNVSGVESVVIDGDLNGNTITTANLSADDRTIMAIAANGTDTLNYTAGGALTFDVLARAADIKAKKSSETDLDLNATKAADLTVNVGQYAKYTENIVANNALSTVLNVASGLDTTGKIEQTSFAGTLTANKSTDVIVNATGLLDGKINAAAATYVKLNTGKGANTLDLQAKNATDVVVNAAGNLDLGGSTLSKVESLTVDTAGKFEANGLNGNLDAIANLVVSGSKADSEALFGPIDHTAPATPNDYNLNITASGLKAGLTLDGITVSEGRNVTINAGGLTGNLKVDDVAVTGGKTGTITINVDGAGGDVTTGDLTAKNVTINAGGLTGKLTTKDIEAAGGTITIDVDGAGDDVELGKLEAKNVVVKATNLLGELDLSGGVTAETATITGSALFANDITVTASKSATISGGIEVDNFIIEANAAAGAVATFTITGGLGQDTFIIDHTTGDGALRLTITDFNNGGAEELDGDFNGVLSTALDDAAALTAAQTTLKAFLESALGGTVTATNITNVLSLDATANGSGRDFIFQYAGATHIVIDGDGNNGVFGNKDAFVTLTGITGISTDAQADALFA